MNMLIAKPLDAHMMNRIGGIVLAMLPLALMGVSGCAGPRMDKGGEHGISPRVKWVFRSGERTIWYLLPPAPFAIEQEAFGRIGLFDDQLVLSSEGGENFDMAEPLAHNIYVIDVNQGRMKFSLAPYKGLYGWPLTVSRPDWRLIGDRLVVGDSEPGLAPEFDAKRAYDLKSGRRTEMPETWEVRQSSLVRRPVERIDLHRPHSSGKEFDPSGRQDEVIPEQTVIVLTEDLRLIESYPDGGHLLSLEQRNLDGDWYHLDELMRWSPGRLASNAAWMGYDPVGDFVLVFDELAMGVKNPLASQANSASVRTGG